MAIAERAGTGRPSDSQIARICWNSGSVSTSRTSTTSPVVRACWISGYRRRSTARLCSIGFSYAATTVPWSSSGPAMMIEQREMLSP